MSRRQRLISMVVMASLGLASLASPARGQQETLSPYFFLEDADSRVDRMPLLDTSVSVKVAGVIADVTVRQTYENTGAHPLHATYVFPASSRAAVHGLSMTIGDQIVRAKIKEREQARREFSVAKRAGKNAALLEQQRPNVFTMSVANIVPGQRIAVELHYSELLAPDHGVYEFVYPTVVGPRYSSLTRRDASSHDEFVASPYTPAGTAPSYTFALEGVVNAGMPVEAVESPSHLVRVTGRGTPTVLVTLDPSERRGGNRDFVLRYRLANGTIHTGLTLYDGGDEKFFLAMVQPPPRVALDRIPPREYVFVVDVSGSMTGFPIATAKVLMSELIRSLRPTDTFDLLLFAGGSRLWAPHSMPATPENVRDALSVMSQESGGGGTELLAALQRAFELPEDEDRSRSVVVVTDGYIAAENEVFRFIRENLGRANLFSFGIGSSVNRSLIEGIARAGMAEPFVVLDADHAEATAGRFREYIATPVLTDLHVAFPGFDAYDVDPAAIPDLMADRPIVVCGKWRGPAAGRVVITGSSANGEFRSALDVSSVEPVESNRALQYLWARSRVATLSGFDAGRETADTRREIVRLGLAYSLLTPFTSFIAVQEVVRNPELAADEVAQPLPMPARVSNAAIGRVVVGPEPGMLTMLAVLILAATIVTLRRRLAGARR